MKSMEEKVQKALIKTLEEFAIPENFYSLGGYAEEAICLGRSGLAWVVYGGERGQKHNKRTHTSCKSACFDIINRLSETIEEEAKMKDYFNAECKKAEE